MRDGTVEKRGMGRFRTNFTAWIKNRVKEISKVSSFKLECNIISRNITRYREFQKYFDYHDKYYSISTQLSCYSEALYDDINISCYYISKVK